MCSIIILLINIDQYCDHFYSPLMHAYRRPLDWSLSVSLICLVPLICKSLIMPLMLAIFFAYYREPHLLFLFNYFSNFFPKIWITLPNIFFFLFRVCLTKYPIGSIWCNHYPSFWPASVCSSQGVHLFLMNQVQQNCALRYMMW